jgi:hypothetical protein
MPFPPARPPHPLRKHLGLLALSLLLGACASLPPPTAQLAVSTAAVAHAQAATGQTGPTPGLALARDKLQRANQALAEKDHLTASRLAEQAQLDALVAESRADTAKAQLAAQDAQAANQALADELARKKP